MIHHHLVLITEQTHDVSIDMMYARADNFTGHALYPTTDCFLHPLAEAKLRKAVAAAKGFGFRLKIFDAYRPQQAQEALWELESVLRAASASSAADLKTSLRELKEYLTTCCSQMDTWNAGLRSARLRRFA